MVIFITVNLDLLLIKNQVVLLFCIMLKGPRVTINPSQIIDPVSKTVMFEEKIEIETKRN